MMDFEGYWMSAWTPLSRTNSKGWVNSLTDVEDFLKLYRSVKGNFIGDKKSPNFGLHHVVNEALVRSPVEPEPMEAEPGSPPDQPAQPAANTDGSTLAHGHDPLKAKLMFNAAKPHWIVCPHIQVAPRKNAGNGSLDLRSFLVRFNDCNESVIPNDGVPFIITGTYKLSCVYGRNKHRCSQRRERALKEEEQQNDQPMTKKRRETTKGSKKIGCPAKIVMKEVIRFPEFQLDKTEVNSKYAQGVKSREVREAMRCNAQLVTEHRIYICVPMEEDHNNMHPVKTDLRLQCDVLSMMQAVQQTGTGGPEVLGIVEVSVPKPGPHEVLMKIHASAINRADTLQRRGLYPIPPGSTPIFGLEAAGEVCDLTHSTPGKWKVGDRVMALLPGGGNAQYATAHEDHLIPVPKHLTIQQAAAIPEVWLTAFQLLFFVANLKEGDIVLIHAGGSGVGTAATQLVKQAGGIPIVTAGTEAKLEKARSLGAAEAFNYKEVDFAEKVLEVTQGKGVAIILDCVGGSYWEKNVKAIAPDGTWVVYGLMGGRNVEGPLLGDILRKRISIRGTTLRPRSDQYKVELIEAFTEKALPHFTPSSKGEQPLFQPIVDRVFPLEEISAAHQYMDENKTLGKVILSVTHSANKPSDEL